MIVRFYHGFPARLANGASFLLVSVLLASCQAYVAKSLDPATTAADFGRRTLDGPELRGALVASGHWSGKTWPPSPWKLGELQGAALHYHPEIAVAKAQAATALAAITTADTPPNPSLSLGPELNANPGAGVSPWLFGFSLDLPIETAGKRGERTAKARSEANAASLRIAGSAWAVTSGVRAALLEIETSASRLELLESQYQNDVSLVAMADSRVKAGEAARTELATYQSQLNRDSLDLADGRSRIDAARAKLADSLGVPATALRSTSLSFGPLDHFPKLPGDKSLRRAALLRRPDVLGSLEEYAAADAGLRLEIANQTPDLHLNSGYTFDQGQSKWALGVGLTLPVDRNRGPIRVAVAKRDEAAAVFERLQIGIRGELDQALATYRADLQRLHEIDGLVSSQKAQLAAAREIAAKGEGDRLVESAARALVFQAELGRIEALDRAQQSLGRLQDSARLDLSRTNP